MTATGLHPDDQLHPSGDDPAWFESFWFSFFVPDRKLMVYVYPWFRPNLGICGGGVLAWDDSAAEPWNITHGDYAWSRPYDPAALVDGSRLTLPQGVTIDCLEPQSRYRVRYSHDALSLDVTYSATQPANISTRPIGDSHLFAGHIDQPGHITGEVTVAGETLAVDCFCMRDRSWGVRRDDNHGMHIGYYHATASATDAFLVVTNAGADPDRSTLMTGYLIRGGQHSDLVSGTARLTRADDGSPATCVIEATDSHGRRLDAMGRSLTRFAYQVQPGMFNWSTLAEWAFEGHHCLGELQDTWHPDGYRAFARSRRG